MQPPKKTTPIRDALRSKIGVDTAPAPVAPEKDAVDEGRKPTSARRKDTAAIKARAIELYGIPAAGLAPILPIESSFKFSPLDTDAEFQPLHVEGLLEQASRLLERCTTIRAEYERLQLDKWKLQVELDRFFRLQAIHDRERAAGLDTLAYERAVFEAGAEKSIEDNHRNSDAQFKALLDDLLASGFNRRLAAHELTAWLSAYPLKDRDLTGDDASYTFDGARKSKPEHLFEAARMEADQAAWEQAYTLLAQRFGATAESEAGRLRSESYHRLSQWSMADIAFRGERAQVESDAGWERVYQGQSPRGVLNYGERIAALESLFAHDFREALARLTAARRGLKDLYDFTPAFPQEGSPGYLDGVGLWARNAMHRIEQIAQSDQCYVLALSVKDLAKSRWEAGRAASEWTFDVPSELFPGQSHVRLRGVSMAVVGQKAEPPELAPKAAAPKQAPAKADPPKPDGFWSARVSAPVGGVVRPAAGEAREIDQKSAPSCFLGCVADRDSVHAREIAGASALRNASPIGQQWRVSLSPKSTGGTATADLQDVQVFLHVAVRSLKS
jgi:hypothetical protein